MYLYNYRYKQLSVFKLKVCTHYRIPVIWGCAHTHTQTIIVLSYNTDMHTTINKCVDNTHTHTHTHTHREREIHTYN